MLKTKPIQTLSVTDVVGSTSTTSYDVRNAGTIAATAVITNDNPSAGSFASAAVSVANDTATITAHGFKTGLKGQLTTDTTLPTGLSTSTDYFIIKVDADTVKFAVSLVAALAGTAINITGAGTGNHTFTATALAGASVVPQWSIDNSVWFNLEAATNITTTANYSFRDDRPEYNYFRLTYALTAGQLTTVNKLQIKEDTER